MPNYRGEVGWSPQLDSCQRLMVRLNHPLHPQAVRVARVTVESELKRYHSSNLPPEAEGREQLVTV